MGSVSPFPAVALDVPGYDGAAVYDDYDDGDLFVGRSFWWWCSLSSCGVCR